MLIVGIDPGTTQSALVSVDETSRPTEARIVQNEEALRLLRSGLVGQSSIAYVEMIASYGMPVGREVFETIAVGLKHRQGPLYGIKGDMWAALAVAVTGYDRERERASASFLEGSERPVLDLAA